MIGPFVVGAPELRSIVMLIVVFAFLFIVALLGSLPRWPKSKELSENPMTGLGLMVVVLMLLMVLGR
jgi:VIT1/CCC1 family predicted Fe2+/Mn2+ transporter